MELEMTVLSKVSKEMKENCHVIALICGIYRNSTHQLGKKEQKKSLHLQLGTRVSNLGLRVVFVHDDISAYPGVLPPSSLSMSLKAASILTSGILS